MRFDQFNQYQNWTETKCNTPAACSALGVAGECGEMGELAMSLLLEVMTTEHAAARTADYLKKVIFHGRPLDRAKLTNELGDILFYLSDIARQFGITLGEVAIANVEKLDARYPNGFTIKDAAERKDERKDELPPTGLLVERGAVPPESDCSGCSGVPESDCFGCD